MERFRPDAWWEGILRPFLLADPTSFLYVEFMAPDLRFAAIALFGILALAFRKRCTKWSSVQWRVVIVLVITFYVWTFASGNGRYFLPGLLLAGPVLVLMMRTLPITRLMRGFLIALFLVLHLALIMDFYHEDPWRVSEWREGAAIGLTSSPLRDEPALFLKTSANSYSAVTPHFHPDSRWVMLGKHLGRDIGSYDRQRLSEAFSSNLPKYAFAPKAGEISDEAGQPVLDIQRSIETVLAPYGFALVPKNCETIGVVIAAVPGRDARLGTADGFWLCPIIRVGEIQESVTGNIQLPKNHQLAFERFEHVCPRFFSPGGGWDSHFEGISRRYYQGTDIRLQILDNGMVSYQYGRSFNFTRVAFDQNIIRGDVELPCARLAGRYRPPWLRD
jgi:hypothetical protein